VGITLGLHYNPKLDSVGVNRGQVDHWKAKFAGKGYKVTIISQSSTAVTSKQQEQKKSIKAKTEERSITETITAGTYRDLEMIDEGNFL